MSLEQIDKLREFNVGGGKPVLTIIDVKDVVSIPHPDTDGVIRDPLILSSGKSPVTYTFQRETPHLLIDPIVVSGADFHRSSFMATIPKDRNSIKLERAKFFPKRVIIIYPDNNGYYRIIGSKSNPVKISWKTDHKEQYQQQNESTFEFKHIQKLEPYYIVFDFENGTSSGSSSAYLPESIAYFNAMATAGDPLSITEKDDWNQVVVSRIENGTWYDRLGVYPFKGKTLAGMSINARNPGTDLTFNGNWIATYWGPVNADGAAGTYIGTGINPSTDLPGDNVSFGYYLDGNGLYPYVCGAYESATKALLSTISTTHDIHSYSSTDKISITKANDYGHYEMSRSSSASMKVHRDGAFEPERVTALTSSAPNYEFIIGGYNNAGSVSGNWSTGAGIRFFEIGARKTETRMNLDRTAFVTWLKASGRYLHPSAYPGFASESNDDFLEIQARSVLFTTLEDNSLLSDMIRLSLQFTSSSTHALKDALDPTNVMTNTGSTPFTYFGFKGNGSSQNLEDLFDPNGDITDIDNFSFGVYSRTDSNTGCDIGSNDTANFLELKIRNAGNLEVNIGTASLSIANASSQGHFVVRCSAGTAYVYNGSTLLGSFSITGVLPAQLANLLSTNSNGAVAERTTREIPLYWVINKNISSTEEGIIDTAMQTYLQTVGKDIAVTPETYNAIYHLYATHSTPITPIDYYGRKILIDSFLQYTDVELIYNFMTRKGSSDIALKNISQNAHLFPASPAGSLILNQDGEKGDASTGYIDTTWAPDPDMSIAFEDDVSVSVFLNENYTGTNYILGCRDGGSANWLSIESVNSKTIRVRVMEGANNNDVVLSSRSGLLTIRRTDFQTVEVWHNGVLIGTFNTIMSFRPDQTLTINALNSGSVGSFSNPVISGLIIGKAQLDFITIAAAFAQAKLKLRGF